MIKDKSPVRRYEQARTEWKCRHGALGPAPKSLWDRRREEKAWYAEDGMMYQRKAVKAWFDEFAVTEWKYRPGTWRDHALALSGVALFLSRMDKRLADDADCLAGMALMMDDDE